MIDGGFYRKRAKFLFGKKSPEERALELQEYCNCLLASKFEDRSLYRIFYYDCPPSDKTIYHPLLNKSINLKNSEEYEWMTNFLNEMKRLRKVALRLGRLSDTETQFQLKYDVLKNFCRGKISMDDLSENDFQLMIKQKGVDMRIGVDISSLSFKKQVQQIILVAGDSDFVPASKQARREGVDFILDPMQAHIHNDLFEHIDGLQNSSTYFQRKKRNTKTLLKV